MGNSTFKTLRIWKCPMNQENGCSNFSDFEAWWSFFGSSKSPKSPTLFWCYHEVCKMLSKKNMVNILLYLQIDKAQILPKHFSHAKFSKHDFFCSKLSLSTQSTPKCQKRCGISESFSLNYASWNERMNWELTYPIQRQLGRWISFPIGGIC